MTTAQVIAWLAFVLFAGLMGFAAGRLYERDKA